MVQRRVDGMGLVGVAFILFMIFNVLQDKGWLTLVPSGTSASAASDSRAQPLQDNSAGPLNATGDPLWSANGSSAFLDPDTIAAPYAWYELTQGLHGFDYGHMAIDIAAGKGAEIFSPINGVVSASFVDDLGNTVLIIENSHYIVTMLHGIYTVNAGEAVQIGQTVGYESNQGNTVDALGRSCRGRDCGYHTHLNIFDKLLNSNANPLDLIK